MSLASRVILVRPSGFGYDPETAASNAFQRRTVDPEVRRKAEAEFDALLYALDSCGIGTTVLDPTDAQAPNAVFPNNWFSTHADGTLVLYPMCTPSRRAERDPRFAEVLRREGFRVDRVIDLSFLEREDRFLEGTGSLVLDRARNTVFAALSPRTTERALNRWCGALGGSPVPFLATMDGTLAGPPVYHTNVVMGIGDGFAVVCLDALPYPADREDVVAELDRAGKRIIRIGLEQMHAYVGNLLHLGNGAAHPADQRRSILLSTTAHAALSPAQRRQLERCGDLVPVAVPTIEAVGGGSVRCMLAENFLARL